MSRAGPTWSFKLQGFNVTSKDEREVMRDLYWVIFIA
jgi:hypothetical protein